MEETTPSSGNLPNETTPLLHVDPTPMSPSTSEPDVADDSDMTPFPYQQIIVLCLCRVCEPIALMSIFPYIYFMIASFGVEDETTISTFAGLITSVFTLCECLAALYWGGVSDRKGRKRVMMIGMAGTGLSMIMFGFSTNIWMALFARAVGGLLNGNIGVIQATVLEMVTNDKDQPVALSILPFVWAMGSIFGAIIGGKFSDPIKKWPGLISPDSIFATYPYLLPNLICAGVVLFSLTVSALFLKETHAILKHQRDSGIEFIERLTSCFRLNKLSRWERNQALLDLDSEDEEIPQVLVEQVNHNQVQRSERISIWKLFTRPMWMVFIAHGLLAFHTMALEQLLPILFATPVSHTQLGSFFMKFRGGLGLSSDTIGNIFAAQGVIQMFAQLVLFPLISNRFGLIRTFQVMTCLYPIYYFAVPFITLAPTDSQFPIIGSIMVYKVMGQILTYPALSYTISRISPASEKGRVMSVYGSSASLARSFGPSVIGSLHSFFSERGFSGMSWWILACITAIAFIQSMTVKEPVRGKRASTD